MIFVVILTPIQLKKRQMVHRQLVMEDSLSNNWIVYVIIIRVWCQYDRSKRPSQTTGWKPCLVKSDPRKAPRLFLNLRTASCCSLHVMWKMTLIWQHDIIQMCLKANIIVETYRLLDDPQNEDVLALEAAFCSHARRGRCKVFPLE